MTAQTEHDRATATRAGARRTSIERLRAEASRAVESISERPEPEAFAALLQLSEQVGAALGVSARSLAEAGSWAEVGTVAGTSRQAAWSRWSG
jgi:hypothetical protein